MQRNTSGFCDVFAALETKVRRVLYEMGVAACSATAKTAEEELVRVQVIEGETISNPLEMKPKSALFKKTSKACETPLMETLPATKTRSYRMDQFYRL